MIPKIIHYAWFGGKMPDDVQARINQWKELLPDWKFMSWNEENWDITEFNFSNKAYNDKKYGFVPDTLRFQVVYKYGGFYLDTDEVILKDLSPLTNNRNVWAMMNKNAIDTAVFGGEKGSVVAKKILDIYTGEYSSALLEKMMTWTVSSNPVVTSFFLKNYKDFQLKNKKQIINDGEITLFPNDYFTYQSTKRDTNFTYHLFENSWNKKNTTYKKKIRKLFIDIFGPATWGKISSFRGARRKEYLDVWEYFNK